jgi:pimeloyl-ACP methyl ester carboxylesterase
MAHLLEGIEAYDVETARLRTRVLVRAATTPQQLSAVTPLLLVHGNCSSSLYFQRLMLALDFPTIAVDLRGYGGSDPAPVDATRGLRDFSDDLLALLDTLRMSRVHLFGWSMGGGVVAQATIDAPGRVASLTLQAPLSPYGFGGTDQHGRLVFADGAGSGAGGVNPRFVELIAAGDGDGVPGADGAPESTSPRATVRGLYVAPRAQPWPDEDLWVASLLTTVTGPDNYPGDAVSSPHWPGSAPGGRGVANAMSPIYCRWDGLVDVNPKPPLLWLHGDADLIVSDTSLLDLATLGSLGLVPGWPGGGEFPPQPMLSQTRQVLTRYGQAGGRWREVSLAGIGHSPHLEDQPQVIEELLTHLDGRLPTGSPA